MPEPVPRRRLRTATGLTRMRPRRYLPRHRPTLSWRAHPRRPSGPFRCRHRCPCSRSRRSPRPRGTRAPRRRFPPRGHRPQRPPPLAVPAQPAPLFSASRPARPDPPTMPEPAQYYGQSATSRPLVRRAVCGRAVRRPVPGLSRPGTAVRSRHRRQAAAIQARPTDRPGSRRHRGGRRRWRRRGPGAESREQRRGVDDQHHQCRVTEEPARSVQALDTPSTTVPPGFTPVTVSPSAAGTTAGFSIDVPSSWTETRDGLITKFNDDNGDRFLEVDLTAHTYTNMVTEAEFIEKQQVAVGTFPGYKRVALKAAPVRGTSGAFWQFTWDRNGVTTRTDDILFIDANIKRPAVLRHLLQGSEQRLGQQVPAAVQEDAQHLPGRCVIAFGVHRREAGKCPVRDGGDIADRAAWGDGAYERISTSCWPARAPTHRRGNRTCPGCRSGPSGSEWPRRSASSAPALAICEPGSDCGMP